MIKKAHGKYVVTSHSGKRLSKPGTKGEAVKRLRQVEYYKSHSGGGRVNVR